ncbi:MAG TPA: UvrD-helicase domain-containing protein [Candidatus Krumholzibacteria bacterium]|nr:UvrD-helicase domain-containing protein [Candidatus Krumholzibacteria bacterium]HPD70667.1 UvrD-helicase domain-containing protein [Candidatus Krumholzibacteria bacterium]HRY39633.1 UvrD-helicase domain-containing protein [Candidatus Krumholzibacteria bacterium]
MSDQQRSAADVHRLAAGPGRSFALEAGAGSGKTTVLVNRFLRLCLTDPGVDPRAVLAITFTRKATVEIQSRLQAQAGRLASLDGPGLAAALTELFGRSPTPAERERAAWFHEVLLEDPVGLCIDTMHAFCQKVLGRFAVEAGLDPRFAVLDERQEAEYRAEALDRLELELARDPEAAASYAGLADTAAGARARVAALFARRVHLQRWLDRVAPPSGPVAATLGRPLAACAGALVADLQRTLLAGTPWQDEAEPRPERIAPELAAALRDLAGSGVGAIVAVDAAAGVTDGLRRQADGLRDGARAAAARLAADPAAFAEVAAEAWSLLVTDDGKLRAVNGRGPTKAARNAVFAQVAGPVLDLIARARLLDLLERNRALLRHGLRALDLYALAKRRDRVVDFQDLEELALRLLSDPAIGDTIHFRLDARLDHILLDEFQDTNRNQWDLLRPLVAELLAGGVPPRTAFVVGDVKQSIYAFRGAEPAVFAEACDLVAQAAGAHAGGEQAVQRLPINYRSLPGIVEAVGDLFTREPLAGFLGAAAAGVRQSWSRGEDRGTVRLVEPFTADEDKSGHERAAAAVVDLVRRLVDGSVPTWSQDPAGAGVVARPLLYSDILVLARTKTHLATYEAALRQAGIPFTPASRGLLARGREVQDLLALLRWLTFPADDTAGATVLRSPLCRVPESEVQALLAARLGGRRRSLREVLRQAPPPGAAAAHLDGWFRLAGLLPLHDLLRRIFREGELLERAETAGGEQARFNLLRVLDLALAAEARGGSLRDFVAELELADRLGGEEEGSLPGDVTTGRVRVMTVHASKGLEGPVVILVDAAVPVRETTEALLLGPASSSGPWLHDVRTPDYSGPRLAGGAALPVPLARPRERALARLREEEAHVLYVAMTRARDRLYVLGGRGDRAGGDAEQRSYLDWLAEADEGQAGRNGRWRTVAAFQAETSAREPSDGASAPVADPKTRARTTLDRVFVWTPPPLAPRYQLVRPSDLDDDRAASPARREDADEPDTPPSPPSRRDTPAIRRGTRVHVWLERACALGGLPTQPPADPLLRADWEEARAVYEDPALGWIFAPADQGGRGLSEVPVMHRLGGAGPERRVTGYIDRLVLRPGRVDVIDYKSNRVAPEQFSSLVDHYRPQLRAYRDALAVLYPDREIRCWLVWTDPARAGDRITEVTG